MSIREYAVWFEQLEETEISVFLDLFESMRVNGGEGIYLGSWDAELLQPLDLNEKMNMHC